MPHDAETGLSDIVPAGPGEVPDDIGAMKDGLPVLCYSRRVGLAAYDDPVGISHPVFLIAGIHVVITDDIQEGIRHLQPLRNGRVADDFTHVGIHGPHEVVYVATLGGTICRGQNVSHDFAHPVPGGENPVDSGRHGPGRVEASYQGAEGRPGLRPGRSSDFRDLISDGIEDDGRVIDVLLYHGSKVALPAVLKRNPVVKVPLEPGPHVGKLIHHIHAELVAGA